MISPCSVKRMRSLIEPNGCDVIASYDGPPPRPTVPPRPWINITLIPRSEPM